jgi:hypothetical protein
VKPPTKWQWLFLWIEGFVGAALIWAGLVAIATHENPIFGGEFKPSGAAITVVVGVFILARAVSNWWILRSRHDDDLK